ncbi:hypothetical protein [Streptomyces nitrosporeus]|uniref:hypothetical protein n=1 Tax=Streptomyces nitrosporeus TaxID=28894 RepID=UPI0039A1587D
MHPPHFRTAVCVIALPLLLIGCTRAGGEHQPVDGEATENGSPGPASAPVVPVIDSANDRPLPLDTYLVNPDQLSLINKAYTKSVSLCMARFGFDHKPVMDPPAPRDSDAPKTRTDGRYGHQNAQLMAKWGYHPEGGFPADPPAPGAARKTSPDMVTAGRGTSDPEKAFGPGGQVVNGKTVPYHGCMGEAVKKLTGSADGDLYDPQIAVDVKMETLVRSQEDGRTREVFAAWSRCMKAAGHVYRDPLAAGGDPEWKNSPLPGTRELEVAKADAECRHENNVVGVWYAVDFALQEKAVAENAAALSRVKAELDRKVKAAGQVLER